MRLLGKLVLKLLTLVIMVLLTGAGIRYGQRYLMKETGVPMEGAPSLEKVQFSSEEADLMSTVFKGAVRLLTGSAKRNEVAGELSDKLYSGQMDEAGRAELGIELVRPGDQGPSSGKAPGAARVETSDEPSQKVDTWNGKRLAGDFNNEGGNGKVLADDSMEDRQQALLERFWAKAREHSIELILVPVVLLGMVLIRRFTRRSPADDFLLPTMSMISSAESGPYDMRHAVHSLEGEEFELLVARIYQRQGYRVSMSAGLGGGREGSFTLLRKSERLLVQCKRFNADHKVPVERVRELHEAAVSRGVTRGLYVAPCEFTWDARNFAKANGVTVIDARMLDALITTARETPDEDPLSVAQWAEKFMDRVELKTPHCPSCGAKMDQVTVSNGAVWVCSHRPECRGRRTARKYLKQTESSRAA